MKSIVAAPTIGSGVPIMWHTVSSCHNSHTFEVVRVDCRKVISNDLGAIPLCSC